MKAAATTQVPLSNPSPYITALAGMRRTMGYAFSVLALGFLGFTIYIALRSGEFPAPLYFAVGAGLLCVLVAISRFHDARETLKVDFSGDNS